MNNINKTEVIMKKKNFIKALFGTIVLVSAMLFTGCTSDDNIDGTANNGNATNGPAVPVDFVFNVATGNTATSRMTSANTQATDAEAFRGINNAVIAAFTQAADGKWISTATTAGKIFNMGEILSSGALDPDGTGTTPKSRRVVELAMPTGTNTMMFWGKAIKDVSDAAQGSITYTVNKDLSTTSFTLNRRITNTDAFAQYKNLLAAVMTKLVDSRVDVEGTYASANFNVNLGWKDYVTYNEGKLVRKTNTPAKEAGDPDVPMESDALGEILADAFISLNTIYANELRAGAGPAVATTLADLYESINKVATATPTSKPETITKALAANLKTWLTTLIDTGSKTWNSTATVKGWAPAGTYNLVTDNLDNFPESTFNIPQGATILQIAIGNPESDANRTFTYSYMATLPTYNMGGGSGFNPLNYRYPAELCYFGNSPVRVTDDPHITADYPDGVANWDTEASWAAGATGTGSKAWTPNSHVLSSTRSVAMQHNINYGTALLKTTVRYGAATLQDNNKTIQQQRKGVTEDNNIITPAAGTFTLKGVLIGGVEETVGWNYIAKAATPTFSSIIYDNTLPSAAIPAYDPSPADPNDLKSAANYTLLWDNWNQGNINNKQNVVYVALEFVNNSGKDFWGEKNLIRNGATFYITGKLDPDNGLSTADRSLGITWPEKYALPPYDGEGNTIKQRRVFIQDYMTTADFVIGETSLQKAMVSVPDLRSTQISLGLSVDLNWQTGLNFNNIILGAE